MNEYRVIAVGGDMDGREIFRTDNEIDAINFARLHENESPLGCAIFHGNEEILNW